MNKINFYKKINNTGTLSMKKISQQKILLFIGTLLFLSFLTACGGGGGSSSSSYEDDDSSSDVVTDDGGATDNDDAETFTITSENYIDGAEIPLVHACDAYGGLDNSPQFTWTNAPADTASFAIIMDDETPPCGTDADACVHWALFNIPSTVTSVAENVDVSTINGAVEGFNYIPTSDYAGPCPPNAHVYHTTVYALDANMATIGENASFTSSEFEAAYSANILDHADISGTFTP